MEGAIGFYLHHPKGGHGPDCSWGCEVGDAVLLVELGQVPMATQDSSNAGMLPQNLVELPSHVRLDAIVTKQER
jgi:hypothetical protein